MLRTLFPTIPGTILFLSLLAAPATLAQDITVSGYVKDVFNRPVENVTIKVKGMSTEASTDTTGYYTIMAPAKGKLLFFRKGYVMQKVPVKGQENISLFLLYDLNNPMDKEVNVGYGKVQKSKLTQSVSSVDEKMIEQNSSADIAQLFETLPGVEVFRSGGDIKLRIRGINTFYGSTDPLVLVDGTAFSGSLRDLNRNDIKSIDVLKDAAACAMYGVQGANGVVLITTKRGR